MLFKLSNLNSNFVLTLGYLNPVLNNSALELVSAVLQSYSLTLLELVSEVLHWLSSRVDPSRSSVIVFRFCKKDTIPRQTLSAVPNTKGNKGVKERDVRDPFRALWSVMVKSTPFWRVTTRCFVIWWLIVNLIHYKDESVPGLSFLPGGMAGFRGPPPFFVWILSKINGDCKLPERRFSHNFWNLNRKMLNLTWKLNTNVITKGLAIIDCLKIVTGSLFTERQAPSHTVMG